ncbi:hypothetical protein PHLGIDRAFT_74133 [Phlebiopsis gigantea 11061_1 CR5-6]|uniref:Peptidase A1 domain-containing protein n=1 Tax=Phlebiopsis gigantea (strain 11061_1 CR5-6) TaxID=745531 RepID=A0A0C3S5B6_PHLG1|nr:hypothetical protein PHLGIDRAFT_74133 [Phlebiopsis gigantea 11061_1 CR5-6]
MFSKLFIPVYLALLIAASPVVVRNSPVNVQLARRFNVTGGKNVLAADQARAKFLKSGAKSARKAASGTSSIPATNGAVTYTAAIEVGSPPTVFNLLVDTGSSNTWVGAGTPFTPTDTSTDTGAEVLVEYGSGLFFGEEFIDQVALSDGLTIPKQSIGVAEFAEGFEGVDGILGIGPTDLTDDTTSAGGIIPTVTDNLFEAGIIGAKQVGISFEPTTSESITNGELTFGGVDTSKFNGTLHTFPITTTSPSNEFVGVDQSITYGSANGTTILAETAGIADTGTTLLLIASDALATYQNITGAVADPDTGLLKLSTAQFANLKSLFFNIGGQSFEFTPNAQIWPRSLNTEIGGDTDSVYLIVSDLGTDSGEGLDFINGFAFLERFYLLFDSGAKQVGFAETQFTFATTN